MIIVTLISVLCVCVYRHRVCVLFHYIAVPIIFSMDLSQNSTKIHTKSFVSRYFRVRIVHAGVDFIKIIQL